MDSKEEKCKGQCLIQVKSDMSLLFAGLTNLIEEVKQLEEELKRLKDLLEIG